VKGKLPATVFQGGDRLAVCQICLYNSVEETHVSLQRKPCMLEAAASRTLFPLIALIFERILPVT
jgi:hypothetical protein